MHLWVLGFPCSRWSSLEQTADAEELRRRREEETAHLRNMMEYIRNNGPDVVILENVPNLLAKGMEEWYGKVNGVVKERKEYWWRHQEVCQWRHAGVPAVRSRLWWIGIRHGKEAGKEAWVARKIRGAP